MRAEPTAGLVAFTLEFRLERLSHETRGSGCLQGRGRDHGSADQFPATASMVAGWQYGHSVL